ncbi:putative MFS-type transporter [Bifidobacterium saguini DSM 23967]|uniref:DHA2 family efflux MFS transporter permease subunit n=2 Tax=Bifidobacterium saguini TaxID=762210 RepID=A0ABX7SAR1_9BIFI|nr:DHA2 family efflux MFS transporter permease subunit [Bifidobacterium saguini]KFI94136.1 putative MFS-type transporter [Bifidobacterium saguini DSM 23967]QTB90437.1 DHA2 family efflux MFS transporter permease subunit [Bifidobacterium saguini]
MNSVAPANKANKTQSLVPIIVMMVGSFTAILNQTLMTSALPYLMREFNLPSNTVQWLSTGFMLTNGIMIPITAFLIQRFTTRQLFFYAIGMFLFGTLVCTFAPGFWVLLLGRILQATGAGILMPLLQTVLFITFPPDKRGTAMGWFGLVIAFAPALGPTLSGLIIDFLPWRFLFVPLIVIAVTVLAIAIPTVKNVTRQTNPTIDMLSVVLSTLGFGGLLLGFSMAGQSGWLSPDTLGSLIVGTVSLCVFIHRQLHLERPMLDFRVFARPMFALSMLVIVLVFVTFIATMNILPMFIQDSLGMTALQSGLLLMGGGVAEGVFNPVAGRLFDRVGIRRIAPPAIAVVAMSTFALSRMTASTPAWYPALFFTIMMTGVAFCLMPLTTTALNQLAGPMLPHGTAMNNTLRQTCAAIGIAINFTIMTMNTQPVSVAGSAAAGLAHGVDAVFLVATIVAVAAFALSLFVRDRS